MHTSNMSFALFCLVVFVTGTFAAVTSLNATTPRQYPVYNGERETTRGYGNHAVDLSANTYATGYEGNLQRARPGYPPQSDSYASSIIPAAQSALILTLRVFAKVGLFLLGGVALLVVGGLFTTAVCSLTPICTITFAGLEGFEREKVRSLVTPERISNAVNVLQDAIGKYGQMQKKLN